MPMMPVLWQIPLLLWAAMCAATGAHYGVLAAGIRIAREENCTYGDALRDLTAARSTAMGIAAVAGVFAGAWWLENPPLLFSMMTCMVFGMGWLGAYSGVSLLRH